MLRQPKIAIIGAGLAGLSCAYYLEKKGYSPVIYDKNQKPGGRIQTIRYKGFLLDHHFQLFLSNYEEVNRLISKKELNLKMLKSGASVRYQHHWISFENPLRNPTFIFKRESYPFFQISDLFKFAKLYLAEFTHYTSPGNLSTADFIKNEGASEELENALLRPFLGCLFLELDLKTQVQVFLNYIKHFITGLACLPEKGMQALPQSIANKLQRTQICYNQEVQKIEDHQLILKSGKTIQADYIILASGIGPAASLFPSLTLPKTHSVTSFYFYTKIKPSYLEPVIYFNGVDKGPINHLVFLNTIQPSYAPPNHWLVCVSVVDPVWQAAPALREAVHDQLASWFAIKKQDWHYLRSFVVPHAMPDQSLARPLISQYAHPQYPHIFLCGELIDDPTINGALYSGRKVADQLKECSQGLFNHS